MILAEIITYSVFTKRKLRMRFVFSNQTIRKWVFVAFISVMEGYNVDGGKFLNRTSERECKRLCRKMEESVCAAVDFNSVTNECFAHTKASSCNGLVKQVKGGRHWRKGTCCKSANMGPH